LGEVVALVEELYGSKMKIAILEKAKGDPLRTSSDCDRAWKTLEWKPKTDLRSGLEQMLNWQSRL
jgi:UDP-glucose 4-epimerase